MVKREKFAKNKNQKILQGKGCHFRCSKFDTWPVSVNLLNILKLHLKSSIAKYLKMRKFGLVSAIVSQAILFGCQAFISNEIRLFERNRNKFTLRAITYILAHVSAKFQVTKQKTTWDVLPCRTHYHNHLFLAEENGRRSCENKMTVGWIKKQPAYIRPLHYLQEIVTSKNRLIT